jgi:hypothetical protein
MHFSRLKLKKRFKINKYSSQLSLMAKINTFSSFVSNSLRNKRATHKIFAQIIRNNKEKKV